MMGQYYRDGRPEMIGRAIAGGFLMGFLGLLAGLMWSAALEVPLWVGGVSGGIAMMTVGILLAPVAGRTRTGAWAMGAVFGGLMFLVIGMGFLVYIIRRSSA